MNEAQTPADGNHHDTDAALTAAFKSWVDPVTGRGADSVFAAAKAELDDGDSPAIEKAATSTAESTPTRVAVDNDPTSMPSWSPRVLAVAAALMLMAGAAFALSQVAPNETGDDTIAVGSEADDDKSTASTLSDTEPQRPSSDPDTPVITSIASPFQTSWQPANNLAQVRSAATKDLNNFGASTLVPSVMPDGATNSHGNLRISKTIPTNLVRVDVTITYRNGSDEESLLSLSTSLDPESAPDCDSRISKEDSVGSPRWEAAEVRGIAGCLGTNSAGLTFIEWKEGANQYHVETFIEPTDASAWLTSWVELPNDSDLDPAGGVDGPLMYWRAGSAGEHAELGGILQVAGDCLVLGQPNGSGQTVILWPFGYRWSAELDAVIPPQGGEPINLGDRITGGGGEYSADELGWFTENPDVTDRIEACATDVNPNVGVLQNSIDHTPAEEFSSAQNFALPEQPIQGGCNGSAFYLTSSDDDMLVHAYFHPRLRADGPQTLELPHPDVEFRFERGSNFKNSYCTDLFDSPTLDEEWTVMNGLASLDLKSAEGSSFPTIGELQLTGILLQNEEGDLAAISELTWIATDVSGLSG